VWIMLASWKSVGRSTRESPTETCQIVPGLSGHIQGMRPGTLGEAVDDHAEEDGYD
jgi:hypothetical protein